MNDQLIKCPLTQVEEACYVLPINEIHNQFISLEMGFCTSSMMIEGSDFNFEKYEELLPELYKSIKIIDEDKRVWYPLVKNIEGKGISFVIGTNKNDCEWAGIKHVLVLDEEKEKFKNPTTGIYSKYKSDSTSLKKFGRKGYIDSLDYIGVL